MSEEAFAQFVAAVIEKLVEKPKNIDEVRRMVRAGCLWVYVRSVCTSLMLSSSFIWSLRMHCSVYFTCGGNIRLLS